MQCFLEVDYFRVSCSLWPIYSLDAWSRTAYSWAKPFPSQSDWWAVRIQVASHLPIDYWYYIVEQGGFAGSLRPCLVPPPPWLHRLTIHPVPQPPPSLWRGWEERCCLHRLAWQGSAMHLKAGGEEERGLREGGGGEEREWRRMRW